MLHFAEAIENRRKLMADWQLAYADARMAQRAAEAEAAGRTGYKPRRFFPTDDVRQLAKEREKAELESVKRATGVRQYTKHETFEAAREAKRESNRRASQKRREKMKAKSE